MVPAIHVHTDLGPKLKLCVHKNGMVSFALSFFIHLHLKLLFLLNI